MIWLAAHLGCVATSTRTGQGLSRFPNWLWKLWQHHNLFYHSEPHVTETPGHIETWDRFGKLTSEFWCNSYLIHIPLIPANILYPISAQLSTFCILRVSSVRGVTVSRPLPLSAGDQLSSSRLSPTDAAARDWWLDMRHHQTLRSSSVDNCF